MKLFQIRTENKNLADIERLVDAAFDAYNIKFGRGTWKGQREKSLTIEIYAPDLDAGLVKSTAKAIKLVNGQESVLVMELEAKGELV